MYIGNLGPELFLFTRVTNVTAVNTRLSFGSAGGGGLFSALESLALPTQ